MLAKRGGGVAVRSPLVAGAIRDTGRGGGELGAIGVDGMLSGQVASRGAYGLVKMGKTINAKTNNFATARNIAPATYALAA